MHWFFHINKCRINKKCQKGKRFPLRKWGNLFPREPFSWSLFFDQNKNFAKKSLLIFYDPTFFDHHFLYPKFFWPRQNSLILKKFQSDFLTFFLLQKWFWPIFFWPKFCQPKLFCTNKMISRQKQHDLLCHNSKLTQLEVNVGNTIIKTKNRSETELKCQTILKSTQPSLF